MSLNKLVKEEVSGDVAKFFVEHISGFHRIQASTMFHESAEYVKGELLKMGLKDVAIEQFPADGAHKYWTHISPMGWTAKSAELYLVEPEERLIVRYEDVPVCLHAHSRATPPEGVTAELVDVGVGIKPEDYEGKDVKGKFVIATGRAGLVHEQAVYKYGALGVVTDTCWEFENVRESLDIPDAHAYQSIWPTAEELDKVTFGFSLSKRQGTHLRTLLQSGKTVKLKAKVDARLFPGNLDVVTATIRGVSRPDEEVFLIAHLCHPKPSANDNASGSGLLLEIVRTVKALVDSRKIAPPARTIRFFWVPETFGSVAYLASHEESFSRFVAGINLDMVGQEQELCKSTLNLDPTPDSLPSYLNDYVFSLIEQSVDEFDSQTPFGSSSTFRYRRGVFCGGSDHVEFSNSSVGVPCVMLLQWPDLYYHTSMDTIDKVSTASLKRIGWIATVAALSLANATTETAFFFASQTAKSGMARIEKASGEAVGELFKRMEGLKLGKTADELAKELARFALYFESKLAHIMWREQKAVTSVKRLGETPELEAFIEMHCEDIAELGQKEIVRFQEALNFVAKAAGVTLPTGLKETEAERELKKLIPTKLFKGSLDMRVLKKSLSEEEYEWYQEIMEKDLDFEKKMGEILNFMDGRRSAIDILKAVSAEYGETDPEKALRFLRDLKKTELVSFK